MNPEQQIKALAELDGWDGNFVTSDEFLPYLTSYDAIIPLIQHQDEIIKSEVVENLYLMGDRQLDRTPSQLCEALLKSVGKWKK